MNSQTLHQVLNIVVLEQLWQVFPHHLVQVSGHHAGAVDDLIAEVEGTRLVLRLNPHHLHAIGRIGAENAIDFAVGFW